MSFIVSSISSTLSSAICLCLLFKLTASMSLLSRMNLRTEFGNVDSDVSLYASAFVINLEFQFTHFREFVGLLRVLLLLGQHVLRKLLG